MSPLRLLQPLGSLLTRVKLRIDRLRLARLMQRGLKVGRNVYIMEGVDFDYSFPYLIEIGDNCRIAKGVRVLAHDATTFRELGVTRLAAVRILEGTFIGERAIILPGVTIGPRALIAAGAVVNRDIPADAAAAGNPARPYGKYSDLLDRYAKAAREAEVFEQADLDQGRLLPAEWAAALQRAPQAFLRGVPQMDPYYVNADYAEMIASAEAMYRRLQSTPVDDQTPQLVETGR
jgi:maltose O-acetyltransferase